MSRCCSEAMDTSVLLFQLGLFCSCSVPVLFLFCSCSVLFCSCSVPVLFLQFLFCSFCSCSVTVLFLFCSCSVPVLF
uniref:Uncharacterized protein n=1 Tax=Globodera rostochiensis TaxID=31243 RepID=A0A914I700_GLORO